MSRPADAPWYEPPEFLLFEAESDESGEGVRSLFGWNGLVGRPASDVALLHAGAGGPVIVGTQRWPFPHADGAESGAVVWLQAIDETLAPDRVRALVHDPGLLAWAAGSITVDGVSTTIGWASEGRWTLGAGLIDGLAVSLVAPTDGVGSVRLRRLSPESAAQYDADPLRAWTLPRYRARRQAGRLAAACEWEA